MKVLVERRLGYRIVERVVRHWIIQKDKWKIYMSPILGGIRH